MGRIEEIRERWEKTTPGPWKAAEQTHGEWIGIHDNYSALGTVFGPADADAITHAREDVPWMLAELQRLNHGRLCRTHYENGPDDEIHSPAGCIICVINRAEKAEAKGERLTEELASIRALARECCPIIRTADDGSMSATCGGSTVRAALRSTAPDADPVEHTNGERRDCAACQRTADAEAHAAGGEG